MRSVGNYPKSSYINTITRPDKYMSQIEELVYSAHEHGQRENLFKEVTKVKNSNPRMALVDVYQEAYSKVMKTA